MCRQGMSYRIFPPNPHEMFELEKDPICYETKVHCFKIFSYMVNCACFQYAYYLCLCVISVPNVSFELYSPSFFEKFTESHAVMTQVSCMLIIIMLMMIMLVRAMLL